MPGKNKTPLLGWHPPAELAAWVRAEAGRRGVPISSVLNEAVEAYRRAAALVVSGDVGRAGLTTREPRHGLVRGNAGA